MRNAAGTLVCVLGIAAAALAADIKDLQGPVLQDQFNRDKDFVRLLFIGSPT